MAPHLAVGEYEPAEAIDPPLERLEPEPSIRGVAVDALARVAPCDDVVDAVGDPS